MTFIVKKSDDRTLTDDDAPTVWPVCSECVTPYAYKKVMSFSVGGPSWAWLPDCKHRGKRPDVAWADANGVREAAS